MLITFEGLDSSGKSTQAKLLVERLKRVTDGAVVHFVREPGGTAISEKVREILLDRNHSGLCTETELFLFSASRAQLVSEVIRPALERNELVVCDRYYDSTTAYQGFGRGVDLQSIHAINHLATAGIVPDLTILLDLTLGEIEERRASAGLSTDRMESSGRKFYEQVRKGYLDMAKKEPGRFVIVDAGRTVEAVERSIWEKVETRLR